MGPSPLRCFLQGPLEGRLCIDILQEVGYRDAEGVAQNTAAAQGIPLAAEPAVCCGTRLSESVSPVWEGEAVELTLS